MTLNAKTHNDTLRKLSSTRCELRDLRKKYNYLHNSHIKIKNDLSELRDKVRYDHQLINDYNISRNKWRNKYKELRDNIKKLL